MEIFKLALVKPKTGDIDGLAGVDYETTLPMIETRYERSFDCIPPVNPAFSGIARLELCQN